MCDSGAFCHEGVRVGSARGCVMSVCACGCSLPSTEPAWLQRVAVCEEHPRLFHPRRHPRGPGQRFYRQRICKWASREPLQRPQHLAEPAGAVRARSGGAGARGRLPSGPENAGSSSTCVFALCGLVWVCGFRTVALAHCYSLKVVACCPLLARARHHALCLGFRCAVDRHFHVPDAACGFVERRSGQAHLFLIVSQLPFWR
jgi:hypothetical protein